MPHLSGCEECGTLLCIAARSAPPSLGSFASFSEDIEPVPGARAARAVEVAEGLADGPRRLLGAGALFGTTASETEARGRCVVADLAEAVEYWVTPNARCGTACVAETE